MFNSVREETQNRAFPRSVWYTGSTAISKGQLLCYDRTQGTATAWDGHRDNYVANTSNTNNLWVAGVASQSYDAVSGGQWIKIFEPGSVCDIAILGTCTVGTTMLTAIAGGGAPGRFFGAGFHGRGTARALQTVSALASATDYSVGVFSSSIDGTATYTTSSKTVTKTGAFAYVPATANLQGNEYVYVLGGGTSASSAAALTPGRYLIASKTSDDAVVLSTAPGSADSKIAFAAVRGNPTVPALLLDGEESGLTEYLSIVNSTAVTPMVGGFSFVVGTVTVSSADATATIAVAPYSGLKKAIKLNGALTTNDYQVTVTGGISIDSSATGLAAHVAATGYEFDADGDTVIWQSCASNWMCIMNVGTTVTT